MLADAQALAAGAMGLPTELFAVPLNTLYIAGLSPYNWDDVQDGYRQWAAKQFGVTGGEIASPRRAAPARCRLRQPPRPEHDVDLRLACHQQALRTCKPALPPCSAVRRVRRARVPA